MNELMPWKMYKQQKTLALEERGYVVRLGDPKYNWLDVADIRSPRAESYLAAELQFFQEPLSRGIEQGRISRLNLRLHRRPTCEELFRGTTELPKPLYSYDRGESLNLLESDRRAMKMYRDLLELLG